jgi:hypothetical protein
VFPYFILGVALLIGLILLGHWFVGADPKQLVKGLRWIGAVVGGLAGLYLLFSGKLFVALALAAALVPFYMRFLQLRSVFNRLKSAVGPSPGQTSTVETQVLRMTLDHDSGEMDGEVLVGAFAGRRLSRLSLEESLMLLRECRARDEESATVLEAYLDRVKGDGWRAADGAGPGPHADAFSGKAMTKEVAYEILGLEPGATADEIKEAHRRLMMKVHPDHGGSTYIAAQINEAKRVLLGES